MPKYNDTFKLNLKDIELIESALHEQVRKLARANLGSGGGGSAENDKRIRECHAVLGKLHNQKIWYSQAHPTGVPLG
ncbi:MAG TPA: hypothetical protein VI457_06285 [Methylococcaceae bacterium]|nr:hypothetical protein [Methylococcaceae bacterium]